ncbi:Proto-chlorophyllide reductase 57 kD subunit superfamily [Hyella patelloides LEGE 07179]|uniref:Proto-chlorophyllide reductase 57 kD subunit superfamily n=1 Tax=Hyella patelloides LEGE 07179 TaxID=945734 RepID=A0A563VNQ0_9CYAN|nr:PCP reductase family protein [Hyella patelloides]VEP13048.1 Proto-chlorophyllide reductase 57 kD subunit superfamily [Hyella patelloides LEGE 07179]
MLNQPNYSDELFWTTEAQLKLKKIPYFVRTQARQKIEKLARAAQLEEVTPAIVEQARIEFGQ